MATKQGTKPAATAADQEFDPKFEWMEYPTNFVLRVNLSGFKKEDLRVQVDSTGRLTVVGQRPAGADDKIARFHKVFQLPSIANVDEISGRFDANVLTLTVPKRPATAPTTIQEIKKPEEPEKDTKPPMSKEDDAKPKVDEVAKKTTDTMPPKEEDAKPKVDEVAKKTTDTMPPKEEGAKPQKALDEVSKVQHKEEKEDEEEEEEDDEEEKAAEEEEREKTTACGGWKVRMVRELEELADMKWADDLVEMARKNKEVIAAAAAAFSLGFFVSHKLFSRK